MIVSTISALLLVGQLVSALPFAQVTRDLPPDITHIAHDEDNGRFLAYKSDGSLYGTYPADNSRDVREYKRASGGQCAKLSMEEVQTLPGFAQINKFADDTWGTGHRGIVTNPDEYIDRPATACVDGEQIPIEPEGEPNCVTNSADTQGQMTGTSGSVKLTFKSGFSNKASWTVTKSSTIGVSASVKATFGIPALGGVTATAGTSAEFTNSVTSTFETAVNNESDKELTANSPSGAMCHVTFNDTTCNVKGKGKVRYVASGWVWYYYKKKTQDHFRWAANIDSILPNVDDRSSFMVFTGSMHTSSKSNYDAVCDEAGTPSTTDEPTSEPTEESTDEPTDEPTSEPSDTDEPTSEPTAESTSEPTDEPTSEPSDTDEPTSEPTAESTSEPTDEPTSEPSATEDPLSEATKLPPVNKPTVEAPPEL